MYSTKILLDSISPGGRRLTTWELTYPRMVHAELMTHREFSRCSASSRAIPSEKMLQRIVEDPALPVHWGANQKGMQAAEELSDEPDRAYALKHMRGLCRACVGMLDPYGNAWCDGCMTIALAQSSPRARAKEIWLRLRDQAVAGAMELAALGLHKQLSNRPTEPWMFITVIVSATNFANWFHLRDHWQAQPEIAWVAHDMRAKYDASVPWQFAVGDWHMPLIQPSLDFEPAVVLAGSNETDKVYEVLKKVSTARCARVSYLNHEGKRDLAEDLALHDRLLATGDDPKHLSPFEHVAQALEDPNEPSGNFIGWKQYRKTIAGEHRGAVDTGARLSSAEVLCALRSLAGAQTAIEAPDVELSALIKKLSGALCR